MPIQKLPPGGDTRLPIVPAPVQQSTGYSSKNAGTPPLGSGLLASKASSGPVSRNRAAIGGASKSGPTYPVRTSPVFRTLGMFNEPSGHVTTPKRVSCVGTDGTHRTYGWSMPLGLALLERLDPAEASPALDPSAELAAARGLATTALDLMEDGRALEHARIAIGDDAWVHRFGASPAAFQASIPTRDLPPGRSSHQFEIAVEVRRGQPVVIGIGTDITLQLRLPMPASKADDPRDKLVDTVERDAFDLAMATSLQADRPLDADHFATFLEDLRGLGKVTWLDFEAGTVQAQDEHLDEAAARVLSRGMPATVRQVLGRGEMSRSDRPTQAATALRAASAMSDHHRTRLDHAVEVLSRDDADQVADCLARADLALHPSDPWDFITFLENLAQFGEGQTWSALRARSLAHSGDYVREQHGKHRIRNVATYCVKRYRTVLPEPSLTPEQARATLTHSDDLAAFDRFSPRAEAPRDPTRFAAFLRDLRQHAQGTTFTDFYRAGETDRDAYLRSAVAQGRLHVHVIGAVRHAMSQ